MHFAASIIIAVAILAAPSSALAIQDLTLVRMPRTTAMGGVGVGLADDDNALFNNPAGLYGQEERRFRLVSAGVEASLDTYEQFGTSLSAIQDFSVSSLNQVMGKDINVRVSQTAMVLLPHFSLAYLVDAQGAVDEYNAANPNIDFGNMITHGIQAGTAFRIANGRRPKSELRIGGAAKLLWRRGGYYNIQTSGFLQATNQGQAFVDELVGGYGMGFGLDLGVQWMNRVDAKTQFMVGASITDIGDTRFTDPHAMAQPQSISFGLGFKKDLEFAKMSLGFDLRNLGRTTAFVNKTHFGGELKLPAFTFYAGANQLNYTWGLTFDVWVVKLHVVSTAEELGVTFHQNTSRRYMLMVDFNMPI